MNATKYTLTIFCFGLLTSLYFCSFDFIGIDDPTHILKNAHLLSIEGLWKFWQEPYFGLYIPVTYSFWWLTHGLFSVDPAPYHFLNILFHSLNGVLVFVVLQHFLKNNKLSFFASLLFLIHPAQAASVPWISEFRGILGAFWALLSVLCLLQYLQSPKNRHLFFVLIFYILSVLSKPSYTYLVLLLPAIYLLKTSRLKDYKLLTVFTLQLVIAVVLTRATQTLQNTMNTEPSFALVLNNLGFYILHTVVPYVSQFDFGYTVEYMSVIQWKFFVSAIVLLGTMLFAYLKFKKHEALISPFGFLIVLLPVLGFLPFSFQYYNTVADRYLYFAILFYTPLLTLLIYRKLKNYADMASVLIIGISLSFYLVASYNYKNELTFAQSIVDKKPDSFVGLAALGAAQLKAQLYTQSEANLLKSIELKSEYWSAHSQLGELFETQKRWQDSVNHFNSIITNENGKYKEIGSKNLGEFYLRVGLAQMNIGQSELGQKNIEMGRNLAPERFAELFK